MIVNAGYRGKVGAAAPKFTYTGQYNVRKDGVVELLTSGTLVFLEPKVIDVFMVGGGGGGASPWTHSDAYRGGYAGGGGGYTRTIKNVSVQANQNISITIGDGGYKVNGGSTGFKDYTVSGGNSAKTTSSSTRPNGGNGGSGGGGAVISNANYGTGGSDGGDGERGSQPAYAGGAGQGFTTREFGEPTGKLYAGGGGGGRYMASSTPIISMGGSGGGGAGAWCGDAGQGSQAASAGGANTGGGGGGGAIYSAQLYKDGASGGSGIVCFRDAQELPELAGTWVLNGRLYPSQTGAAINESIKFTAVTPSGNFTGAKIGVGYTSTSTVGFYLNQPTTFAVYQFSNNKWADSTRAVSQITFPAGATASDEFRAWLASNAKKTVS